MWKLIVLFLLFAAAAIFVLTRSGGDVDLTGEKHSVEAPHGAASAAAPAASAVPTPPASPAESASAAASAASR